MLQGKTVTVHCTGMLELPGQDLKKFWSTSDSGKPFSFQVRATQGLESRSQDSTFLKFIVIALVSPLPGTDPYSLDWCWSGDQRMGRRRPPNEGRREVSPSHDF